MKLAMELKKLPPQPVLRVRAKVTPGEYEEFFKNAYGRLFPYLETLGAYPAGPPVALYDDLVTKDGIELAVCVPTDVPLPEEGDISSEELPGGEFASAMHIGPYDGIGRAYVELMTWIFEKGYRPSGPSREVHLACLHRGREPEEHVTEILFPVRRAA